MRITLLIALALTALPSASITAADLTGPLGRGLSSSSLDRQAIQRALVGSKSTSIQAEREAWRLREQLRDIDRAARQVAPRVAPAGNRGLRDAAFNQSWTRDIRGLDRRLGTAKTFVQLGRLLDQAERARSQGRIGQARELVDKAQSLSGIMAELDQTDPNVAIRSQQYAHLLAWKTGGS